jgi:signal transduction histidine kinase
MLNRLWFRMFCAFCIVIAIATLGTVLLTRQGAATQFDHFMVADEAVRPIRMQEALAAFYRSQRSWAGLDTQLDALVAAVADGAVSGMMGGMMGMHDNRVQVVDLSGQVVADSHGPASGERLPTAAVHGWPILIDGAPVGELLVEGGLMGAHGVDGGELLSGVTRAVLWAAMAAGLVGVLLAAFMVRQITRPLVALTRASGQVAEGDLDVRVPVQNRDELGQLAATFNVMADSLQTQETVRRNMVADIAHELRTPLAAIQGTVEAMQDGVFPLTPDGLTTIHEQIMLLNRLVEDLRLLANAEAGQLSLAHAPVDVEELCHRAVSTVQTQALNQGVALHVGVASGLPPLCGDEQRLGQVLNNLLDNALRHTRSGGAVVVGAVLAEQGVRLTVTDSGEGIPPAEAAHIFDRLYRADGSRSRAAGGSGLGLAIARQLVEAHGGRIWVQSPPAHQSRGSEFGVWLPAERELTAKSQRPERELDHG